MPIFRSPEQERLLAHIFLFADAPLSIRELARRAGTSPGTAHKEVERLEAAGLVRSEKVGRNRMISPAESSPLYPELRGLLLKTLGPESLLRKALAPIEGIRQAFIYGSWADPSHPSPADIDVLVIGQPDVGAVYDAVATVEHAIGRPINVTVRPATEWDNAEGAFERAVKAGPRVVLK